MNFDLELTTKIIWCLFIIAWGVIRFRPNIKSRKTAKSMVSRTPSERFSMIVSSFGLGYIPAVYIFTDFLEAFNRAPNIVLLLIGTAILLLSLRLFRLTHKALGKMWSHSLDLREDHKLVTTGIYERVRHPMYTAFWLWAVGAAFLLPNWIASLSGLIGFGTLYFLRVGQEEAMMREEFGKEYDIYIERTKRIIPGVY
ncbi:MAG: protein-S-isoprenylcysteine O-methyltransferase [Pseudomonadota bacterium]